MRSKVALRIKNETPEEVSQRVREYYDTVIALGKCKGCGTVHIFHTRLSEETVNKILNRNAYL